MEWRQQVRAQQSRRRRSFFARLAVAYVIWFGATGLAWWIWTAVFHRSPPDRLILSVFLALGGVLLAVLDRLNPALPFGGKAPEEAAAEAFIAKQDVRSDDHNFERDLKG